MVLVDVRHLRKDFATRGGRVRALAGMSFTIPRGAVCAVVGPSGSGKSTLLGIVGGLDVPTAGEVYVGGRALHRMSAAERTRFRLARIGFVFQSNNLLPVLTAAENVGLPLALRGVSTAARARRVDALLDELGLRGLGGHRPGELSGGQQQRVGIARALIVDPTLILADEPTAHLDSQTGRDVLAVFRAANRDRGTTFIFSTHDAAIESLADERVMVRDGVTLPPCDVPTRIDEWQHCSASHSATSAGIPVVPPSPPVPSPWVSSS